MRTQSVETELSVIAPPVPAKLRERREPVNARRVTEPNLIDQLVSPRSGSDRRDEKDRRASPRVEVELECEERGDGSRYFRLTQDLSTFGLSTRQGFPHAKGTRLQLMLHLPDEVGAPLELTAEVVGPYDTKGGTRLAFKNPSVQDVKRIHRFLISKVPQLGSR